MAARPNTARTCNAQLRCAHWQENGQRNERLQDRSLGEGFLQGYCNGCGKHFPLEARKRFLIMLTKTAT